MNHTALQRGAIGIGLALGAAIGVASGNLTIGIGLGLAAGGIGALLINRQRSRSRIPLPMISATSLGMGDGILLGYLAGVVWAATEFQTAAIMFAGGLVGAGLAMTMAYRHRKKATADK